MIDVRRGRDSIYVRVSGWKILKEGRQSRIKFKGGTITNEIIQGREQRRVFTASRVIAVNKVVPSIFGVLFIEKASYGENYVQVICTDIHAYPRIAGPF